GADEAPRQCPGVLERSQLALDQEDFEVVLIEAEHDAVDRERGACVLVREAHRSALPIATNARISASSRSKPPDRIGNRHQERGSTLRSSRWKLGAMRSRFPWFWHHLRKKRSIQVASCAIWISG